MKSTLCGQLLVSSFWSAGPLSCMPPYGPLYGETANGLLTVVSVCLRLCLGSGKPPGSHFEASGCLRVYLGWESLREANFDAPGYPKTFNFQGLVNPAKVCSKVAFKPKLKRRIDGTDQGSGFSIYRRTPRAVGTPRHAMCAHSEELRVARYVAPGRSQFARPSFSRD